MMLPLKVTVNNTNQVIIMAWKSDKESESDRKYH